MHQIKKTLNTKRKPEETAVIKHNAMVNNPDIFVKRNYDQLRTNAIAKMKRDKQYTNDPKRVEQFVALYVSSCIRELSIRTELYLQ